MADPLLTTLCTTCHSRPPCYRCPRCGARSCSLPCIRKHKSWASCTGIRDVTAFVPAAKLRTPAGIDHDYNFLTSIERARDRATRDIVDERALLRPGEGLEGRWVEKWRGDELRFQRPSRRGMDGEGASGASETEREGRERRSNMQRALDRAFRAQGVEVVHVPKGMARDKENGTTWNKRKKMLLWQVEWLVYEDGLDGKPTRISRKAFENVPLYKGFSAAMEWVLHGREKEEAVMEAANEVDGEEEGPPRKKKKLQDCKGRNQDGASSWPATAYPVQNPITGDWFLETRPATDSWDAELAAEGRRRLRYYLLAPRTKPKQLIPVTAGESLREILKGRSVVGFPTVYILPALSTDAANGQEAGLPPDYVLGSIERRPPPQEAEEDDQDVPIRADGSKRPENPLPRGTPGRRGGRQALLNGKIASILNNRSQKTHAPIAGKKRKVAFAGIQDLDDGEVNSDGEELEAGAEEDSDETSSSGTSSSESDESSSEEQEQEEGLVIDVLESLLEAGAEEVKEMEKESGKKPLVVYESWSESEGE